MLMIRASSLTSSIIAIWKVGWIVTAVCVVKIVICLVEIALIIIIVSSSRRTSTASASLITSILVTTSLVLEVLLVRGVSLIPMLGSGLIHVSIVMILHASASVVLVLVGLAVMREGVGK